MQIHKQPKLKRETQLVHANKQLGWQNELDAIDLIMQRFVNNLTLLLDITAVNYQGGPLKYGQ
ncbi:MAG: hypothetical protein ACI9LY_000612 [Arenicella sp.]|jgi:hypothetical protein